MTTTYEKLLEALEQKYPDKLPDEEVTPFELGRLVGNQDVINYILQLQDYEEHKSKGKR